MQTYEGLEPCIRCRPSLKRRYHRSVSSLRRYFELASLPEDIQRKLICRAIDSLVFQGYIRAQRLVKDFGWLGWPRR